MESRIQPTTEYHKEIQDDLAVIKSHDTIHKDSQAVANVELDKNRRHFQTRMVLYILAMSTGSISFGYGSAVIGTTLGIYQMDSSAFHWLSLTFVRSTFVPDVYEFDRHKSKYSPP